jgi:hypothetical protein
MSTGNELMVISPYYADGVWAFDDPARGLAREALVAGMPEIIRAMVGERTSFTAIISAAPFPGAAYRLDHERHDTVSGDWYQMHSTELHGWLCPALLRFFATAPAHIYISIKREQYD